MKNGKLAHLEREVEEARNRVANDLARLSSGSAADLRHNLTSQMQNAKDQAIERVRDAARERASGVLDGIKARIAANPAAALAVGAGIAWRLYGHPPVATVLVGAGLTSLLRTDPHEPRAGAQAAHRAAKLAASARERMAEFDVDAAKQRIGDYADTARETLTDWGEQASEATRQTVAQATDATRRARDATLDAVEHARNATLHAVGQVADTAEATRRASVRRMRQAMHSEQRDAVLLGAAGLALAAAVGIAWQRRDDP